VAFHKNYGKGIEFLLNSGGSNNVSLNYERYASSGCWDLGLIKLAFVAKTQFLSLLFMVYNV